MRCPSCGAPLGGSTYKYCGMVYPDAHKADIEQKFGRSSYEDLITKTQSFSTLISAGCPPLQAFSISHVTVDPESAAIMYEQYQKEREDTLNALPETVRVAQQSNLDGSESDEDIVALVGTLIKDGTENDA